MIDLLGKGVVRVYLDGRHPDAVLPGHLIVPAVQLEVGYDLPRPIHDLRVDPLDGIEGTFSYMRVPHATVVPWAAVFALVYESEEYMWPGEVPRAVRGYYHLPETHAPRRRPRHLRLVPVTRERETIPPPGPSAA